MGMQSWMCRATLCASLLGLASAANAVEVLQADATAMADAFLAKHPDAVELAPGAYEVAGPNGGREIHTFGEAGREFDLQRYRERLADATERLKRGERSQSEVAALESTIEAIEQQPEAKGLVSGVVCGAHPYELLGTGASGTSGRYTVARAEIEFLEFGPPAPNALVTAFSLATIYCSGGTEPTTTDYDEDYPVAYADTEAACPAGATALGWEAYLLVEVYVAGTRCGYRGYNPSNNF